MARQSWERKFVFFNCQDWRTLIQINTMKIVKGLLRVYFKTFLFFKTIDDLFSAENDFLRDKGTSQNLAKALLVVKYGNITKITDSWSAWSLKIKFYLKLFQKMFTDFNFEFFIKKYMWNVSGKRCLLYNKTNIFESPNPKYAIHVILKFYTYKCVEFLRFNMNS